MMALNSAASARMAEAYFCNDWREPPAGLDLKPQQTRSEFAQNAPLTLRHRQVVLYSGLGALSQDSLIGKERQTQPDKILPSLNLWQPLIKTSLIKRRELINQSEPNLTKNFFQRKQGDWDRRFTWLSN